MNHNKKIHDISMLITPDMMVYKDNPDKKPRFTNMRNHQNGTSHEATVCMDIHCGTHIDMPLHMINKGSTMDTFDFTRLITPCKVFNLTHISNPVITAKDIKDLPILRGDFVLLKTKNSYHDKSKGFDYEHVYVDESGARLLAKREINGVGIDSLGIERAQADHMTHKSLLSGDIIILEGLELGDISEGEYELIALPIKLMGVEGSWVRAVLVEND